jgi:hypothetical protein
MSAGRMQERTTVCPGKESSLRVPACPEAAVASGLVDAGLKGSCMQACARPVARKHLANAVLAPSHRGELAANEPLPPGHVRSSRCSPRCRFARPPIDVPVAPPRANGQVSRGAVQTFASCVRHCAREVATACLLTRASHNPVAASARQGPSASRRVVVPTVIAAFPRGFAPASGRAPGRVGPRRVASGPRRVASDRVGCGSVTRMSVNFP